MSGHTPGPWEADGSEILLHGTPYRVAEVSDYNGYTDLSAPEVLANARLIAAAPELLEALKTIHAANVKCAENGYGNEEDMLKLFEANGPAFAAIRKATGKDND